MSLRKGLEFETTMKSDTTALNHTVMKLLDEFGSAIKFLRDPTRGGLASVLNEIARLTHSGYEINQFSLPIDPQTEGACEMLGLDPLYIANEGIFVAIIKRQAAEKFLSVLRNDVNGTYASIVGEVTASNPGKVILNSSIGGQRLVSFLPGEQLPRIC
jgi:hydrogenase expression/formation protein HypE